MTDQFPERNTDAYDAYWAKICGHGGRCGKPQDEPHDAHVQYDTGGQILSTWRSSQYYDKNPIVDE